MGNRQKGKPKKKSIKAALGSDAGSKRKLSRMGKKQKKEKGYIDATYIGRSKCLKMLQIDLKDFRRLCILKGIYPREPEGRVPGKKKGQSFYHIKDIRAIAHEEILDKFREFKSYMKKVRRAAGRNERDEALRKNALVPTYTLHHVVKERYPRFADALGDLDDALTLTFLFATLPGEGHIRPSTTNKAKSMAAAWGAFCATTSCITKSFISVKGIYLEASIQNVTIRWIVPHSFTQFLPADVDFRIMGTFLEFYETQLNFVMYKLYNDIGVRYPFHVKDLGGVTAGSTSALLGANLRALTNALNSAGGAVSKLVSSTVETKDENDKVDETRPETKMNKKRNQELVKSVGAALNNLVEEEDEEEGEQADEDGVDVAGPLQAALENIAEETRSHIPGGNAEVDDDTLKRKRLFAGLVFFFSREIPRGYLELVCLSYGGKVGWDGNDSPVSERDSTITHHIVDRPRLPSSYESLPRSREYVQPQWILDSANFMFLLPISRYAVGAVLPPHLSPWVDDEEEGYKPAYAEEIEKLKNGESLDEIQSAMATDDEQTDRVDDEAIDETDTNDEDMEDSEAKTDGQEEEEEEDEEEEEEEEEDEEVAEKRKEKKRKKEAKDAHALAKTMMNKKAAHLYGRMKHGIARKQEKIDTLKERRKAIEETIEKSSTGKTAQKQKVERLKKERKSIEDSYSSGKKKKSRKGR